MSSDRPRWAIYPVRGGVLCEEVHAALTREDLLRFISYDGAFQRLEDFQLYTTTGYDCDAAKMYAVADVETGELYAFYYLTGFTGRTAFFHFTYFKAGKPYHEAIARFVLDHEMQHHSALIGLTPFKHVALFGERLGWRILDVIPGACSMPDGQTPRPGYVLAYYNPQTERIIEHGWWR